MNIAGALFLIYMLAVGWHGNADDALEEAGQDVGGFAPFIAALIFLMFMRANSTLRPLVNPFITLALITTVLRNWPTVKSEAETSYNILKGISDGQINQ